MGSGGKRRHRQAGPDEDDDQNRDSTHGRSASSSSTSSSQEGDPEDSKEDLLKCSHAASSVLESKVRKAIKPAYVRIGGLCNECNRLKLPPDSTTSPSYLMCLACGLQFCKAHLQDHFKAQRNGPQHCIALDLSDWALSCNSCGPNLSPDSSKRLRDVYEFVKRSKINKKKSVSSHVAATSAAHHNSISSSSSSTQLPKVRGLTNLGNTCFFNSIMQCLTQSHPLLHSLDLHSQKGAPFRTGKILGGDVLSLQLEDAGPLTLSLAAFLKEMNSLGSKSGSYNPSQLFGRISHRSPQFRGFQQEDSHELLRHLMEAVKSEEVNRQKSSILKHLGLNDKASRAQLGPSLRKKLQSCNRFTNHTLVDRLFGGHLVSTILCEVCHNSSQIFEPFLDISLPLIEEKPPRPGSKVEDDESGSSLSCFGGNKRSNSVDGEGGPNGETISKSKSKKEKRMAKKEMRRNKKNKQKSNDNNNNNNGSNTLEEITERDETAPSNEVKEDEGNESNPPQFESPSKPLSEEDKKEETKESLSQISDDKTSKKRSPRDIPPASSSGPKDGNEEDDEEGSGNEEENNDWEWYTDSAAEDKKDGEEEKSKNNGSNLDSELKDLQIDLSLVKVSDDSGDSSNADVEDNITEMIPSSLRGGEDRGRSFSISQLSYHPDSLHLDPRMQELSRNVRRLSVQASTLEEISDKALQEYAVTSEDEGLEDEDLRVQNDWISRSLTSIAPRYSSRCSGELSIYSCLAQFTAPELLTGQNKWACDKCTRNSSEEKQRGDRCSSSPEINASDPKTVYSNASKQLSIFSPPFILTIHLKRFQQSMCSLRKINKHVDFPLNLDLAPFCSSAAVSTPCVDAGQEVVKYYLFGLVCHSGRLHGGHYTAYVKVRPRDCSKDFTRFYSGPPVKNDEINDLLQEIERKFNEYASKQRENEDDNEEASGEKEGNTNSSSTSEEPYKWYHVSDSLVTEVSEDRVLKSQAYILFYERFL